MNGQKEAEGQGVFRHV